MKLPNYAKLNLPPMDVPTTLAVVDSLPDWQVSVFDFDYKLFSIESIGSQFLPIAERFKIQHARVLRIPAQSCYDWHVDGTRLCAINVALSVENSLCLFKGRGRVQPNVPTQRMFQIEQLQYQLGAFYLFNTAITHMVVNMHHQPRLLLTIEVSRPTRYEALYSFCAEQGLIADQAPQVHPSNG